MTAGSACLVCEAESLNAVSGYSDLPRVTSDCKPYPSGGVLHACSVCGAIQKIPDARWLDEIREIYAAYEIYGLSDGAEQVIFTGEGPTPRSQRLTEFLKSQISLPAAGRLLDVGCGNGAALKRFSELLPGWQLNGSELSDAALPYLRALPNFKRLYTGEISKVDGPFELISMIHSLEHMLSPARTVADAVGLLKSDGALLIEVPDAETSPFDLLVADHLTHFSRATLGYLAARAGLHCLTLASVLPKEITLIGRRGTADPRLPDAQSGLRIAKATVQWLGELLRLAQELSQAGPFGIFGTSISGMWLYGALKERVAFFIDEDASRVGRKYEGRPILSPAEVPPSSTVIVPLAPSIAQRVAERQSRWPARFVPAPPLAGVMAA